MGKVIESFKSRQNSIEIIYPCIFDVNIAYEQLKTELQDQARIICEVVSFNLSYLFRENGVVLALENIMYADAPITVYHAKTQTELLKSFGLMCMQRDKHFTILYSPKNRQIEFNNTCKNIKDLYNGFYKTAGCDLTKGQTLSHSLSFFMPPLSQDGVVIKIEVNNMESLPESMFLQTEINEAVKSIVFSEMSELEKIKAIERWIKQKIRYIEKGLRSDHKSFNAFINGHGVCQGIAGIAQYMMEAAGLKARYITGKEIKTNIGHAWNMVKYGERWYHVDFTNSPPSFLLSFTNPLKEDSEKKKSYVWENEFYSDEQNNLSVEIKTRLSKHRIILFPNAPNCMIDTISIDFYNFIPLLSESYNTYISLSYLLILLGIPFEKHNDSLLLRFLHQSIKINIIDCFGEAGKSVVEKNGNYYMNIRYLMELLNCNMIESRGIISITI